MKFVSSQPPRSSYDLAVIGAGVIGLSCAWRAAQAGMSVVVLERDEPGAGASGVAAGMLAPVTEADFGEEGLLRLNVQARELWPGFAAELAEVSGMPTGYADSGALVVAADRDDVEELQRLHGYQGRLGLRSEWLGPRAARALEPGLSPRIGGAIDAPDEGHVDPGAVVRALVTALENAGGRVVSGVEAEALDTADGKVRGARVRGSERFRAERVLVATGAWSAEGELGTESSAPEVRPVKGQLLELRTRRGMSAPARRLIRTPRCYVVTRRREEGGANVVIGATMEEQGFDTAVTAGGVHQLLEAAYEVLPDVAELELVRARAGLRPFTPDGHPAVGPGLIEGVFFATGHGRNGVLQAPLTARSVLELLRGGEASDFARSQDRAGAA